MGSQEVLHVCSLPFKGRVGVGMGRMGQFTFAPSLSRGGLGWGWGRMGQFTFAPSLSRGGLGWGWVKVSN